jgi:hypothetical protein
MSSSTDSTGMVTGHDNSHQGRRMLTHPAMARAHRSSGGGADGGSQYPPVGSTGGYNYPPGGGDNDWSDYPAGNIVSRATTGTVTGAAAIGTCSSGAVAVAGSGAEAAEVEAVEMAHVHTPHSPHQHQRQHHHHHGSRPENAMLYNSTIAQAGGATDLY